MMLAAQLKLMTRSWTSSALPWKTRSKWVGYSSACYAALAHMHWIYVVQAVVAYLSDYVYAGRPHVTHGIDRWLSTALTLHMALYMSRRVGCHAVLGVIPVGFLYADMRAVRRRDWEGYVLHHTLWHISGPCVVLICDAVAQ